MRGSTNAEVWPLADQRFNDRQLYDDDLRRHIWFAFQDSNAEVWPLAYQRFNGRQLYDDDLRRHIWFAFQEVRCEVWQLLGKRIKRRRLSHKTDITIGDGNPNLGLYVPSCSNNDFSVSILHLKNMSENSQMKKTQFPAPSLSILFRPKPKIRFSEGNNVETREPERCVHQYVSTGSAEDLR